ncbi:flagellar biosynthesis anti-sigma factor FlgM [Desulfurella sp.]|uniref:flagellar biosynthesis anti-sigma factor FlgM n=1 Tax=Desulfurella sp. TaxID=1962857 RepID=UPI0025BCF223|nr:flagellar biosynthesis anti-sigma factor FlgM [Desulfurella sp.]
MKIIDVLGSNIDALTNQKKTQKNDTKQNIQFNDSKKNITQDSVNISDVAKFLANLSNMEVNHQKRLESVQKSYENGTYKPDLTELAKSILEALKNG